MAKPGREVSIFASLIVAQQTEGGEDLNLKAKAYGTIRTLRRLICAMNGVRVVRALPA